MSVPKPPKKREISPDVRMERLLEWKRLFEEIDPSISVWINNKEGYDNTFHNKHRSAVGYVLGLEPSHAKILVVLPRDFSEGYLVGEDHDHMYCHQDVTNDPLYDNEGIAAQPVTKPWKEWYDYLCDCFESIRQSVPKPPP